MKKRWKRFLYHHILSYAGLAVVKIISSTYRVRIVDPENETRVLDGHGSIIYASWHQRFFPGIEFFASRKPIAIMISQSRDGDFITHIVNILGWRAVRGSSSRGGREALDELRRLAEAGYKIGHIVDGPKGPFGKIKPGLVWIAKNVEKPVVPTITSGQNRWTFNSWDRFMIPKPFSRVLIRFGEPIDVPADLDTKDFTGKQLEIETAMENLYRETDALWNDSERIRSIFAKRERRRRDTE